MIKRGEGEGVGELKGESRMYQLKLLRIILEDWKVRERWKE